MAKKYEIIIIGAGVVGTASMYALSRYSEFKDVLIIEKEKDVALLNSNSNNNSQTLHSGEIETNYSIEKTKETKENAKLVVSYANKELDEDERKNVIQKCQKMTLAVGDEEIDKLEKRYDSEFKEIFPYVKKLDKKEDIAKVEPNVVKGREENQ
ncbi:MAG: FAD-dependent oxidoreductase, partial [Candidatus Parvarchaeum sp.]|nr:FAD-dependent oxidoreductase [Candidatus Parvarchaeum tengchongense]